MFLISQTLTGCTQGCLFVIVTAYNSEYVLICEKSMNAIIPNEYHHFTVT